MGRGGVAKGVCLEMGQLAFSMGPARMGFATMYK
jgi:hypothetical protein